MQPLDIKILSALSPSARIGRGSIAKLVLGYTMYAVAASGISSNGVKAEFEQHAKEEQEHVMAVAERINQLGGKPDFREEMQRVMPRWLRCPECTAVSKFAA